MACPSHIEGMKGACRRILAFFAPLRGFSKKGQSGRVQDRIWRPLSVRRSIDEPGDHGLHRSVLSQVLRPRAQVFTIRLLNAQDVEAPGGFLQYQWREYYAGQEDARHYRT